MNIIKRILEKNKGSWDSKFKLALWADRMTIKKAMGKSSFELVYGSQAKFPHFHCAISFKKNMIS